MMTFYPGDQAMFPLAKLLLAISAVCGAGLLASLALKRNYSAKHSILLSTLICILLLPGIALVFLAKDVSLFALPWPTSETPFVPSEPMDVPVGRVSDSLAQPIVATRPQASTTSHNPRAAPDNTAENRSSLNPIVPLEPGNFPKAAAPLNQSLWRKAVAIGIVAWVMGTLLLLARLAWSSYRLVRLAGTAFVLPRDRMEQMAKRLEMMLGRGTLVRIGLSEYVPGPLAFGVFRKVVLLPPRLLTQLSENQLADVLLHEAAHLVRHDPLVLLLQRIAACLYWPIPFIHLVNRQLSEMREELCDNHVLIHRDPIQYGETLLRVAELACFGHPIRGANSMLTRTGRLERRIAKLLDARRNKMTQHSRRCRVLGFGLVLLVGVLTTGIKIVSANADAPMEANEAESNASRESLPFPQFAFAQDPAGRTSEQKNETATGENDPAKKRSHRVIFKPLHGMEKKSSWTALASFPMGENEPYEQLIARLTLQGVIPVQRIGDKEPLFKIQLMAGSDDSLNVRLTGSDKMPHDRILHRDQPLTWKIKGQTYRIVYPTSEVAADQPAESHYAVVFVTCRPVGKPKNADDPKGTEPPGESKDDSKGDGGSDLLRNIRASTAPILKDLAEKAGYGLKEGQAVRLVPLPFSELRTTYYRVGHPHQAELIPEPPTHMLFHLSDGKLRNWGMSFGGPPESGQTVSSILTSVTDFDSQEIEGQEDLLKMRIAGDWVVRPDAKAEMLLPQLEAILRKELGLPIRLEIKTVERSVFVASGKYELTPLEREKAQGTLHLTDKTITTDRVHIFGKSFVPNSGAGGGTGDLDEFLGSIGRWIKVPIVNEVEQPPSREISYYFHQRSPFTEAMQMEDHDAATVLGNISKQTNLKFTRETRPVKVLAITRER